MRYIPARKFSILLLVKLQGFTVNRLKIGDKVPNFSLASTKGVFNLQNHSGNYVVLYFYPKDNTPGCTREGQDFRDLYAEFAKQNVEIFGISRDSIQSHLNFKETQDFPFALLSDAEQTACRMFDVLDETSSPNKETCSMIRTTFVIDPAGTLIKEWRKVKVDGHAAEVLKFISEQQA